MVTKYNTMIKNETWELVDRCLHDNIINCIWLFKVKERVDNSVDHLKACMVAKGTNQIKGLDYIEIFSLVLKLLSIRFFLTMVVTYEWMLCQIDIKNADIRKNQYSSTNSYI